MNRRNNYSQQHTPVPLTHDLPCPVFTRTSRKPAFHPNRTALLEIDSNNEIKSNHKVEISRQGSIEYVKANNRQSSSKISSSKWLDSEKEMMEFIMSLKGKKTGEGKGRKITDGF